jgi:hypothetical protein
MVLNDQNITVCIINEFALLLLCKPSHNKKNWLFCWTEMGAEHVGIVQSLLVTCRLHGIDPYEYFVDVLQRVKEQAPLQMDELTPRRWKELFAQNPKRSVLHLIDQMRKKDA